MSKAKKNLIKLNKNEFIDRHLMKQNENFPELTVHLDTIDSVLLLLNSEEEKVLLNGLRHLMEYTRRSDDNIALLKEKSLLELLLQKEFFRGNSSVLIKRSSLYLATTIIENNNFLREWDTPKLSEIIKLVLSYYLKEDDDFCGEYLSVIINKCMDDPQCVEMVRNDSLFVQKCLSVIAVTTNPDVMLHSLELLHKMLLAKGSEEKQGFVNGSSGFPLNRLTCELDCEHFEVRKAALKIIKFLLLDPGALDSLRQDNWPALLLEKLTNCFCIISLSDEKDLLVEVLAAAMQHDSMISLFFQLNLFDRYRERINDESFAVGKKCKALWVFAECAKCLRFLARLVSSEITEKFLECLLNDDDNPDCYIFLGLSRLLKSKLALKLIIDAYEQGLLQKILKILSLKDTKVRTREHAAILIENILPYAFHKTSKALLDLNLSGIVANIFAEEAKERSIDLLLTLLNTIETMAANGDYRMELCKNSLLITNMGKLLQNSFSNAILVAHLFRCLCCLVDVEETHELLLKSNLCSSIKRALQSPSNQLKTAVTNFIMQTTRFPKLIAAYKESGVLEVLLLNQKHAFCVPTWQPAIESVLAKNLTMKFCIRNSLGFTDITAGTDFKVSKRKFRDFRVFQCILKEDVSPLHPVIVVNFNRLQDPEHLVVRVPVGSYKSAEVSVAQSDTEWCYCRSPGDEFLPKYLQEVNSILESQNLATSATNNQMGIDFDNLAKRAKVIAQVVERAMGKDLKLLDINATEECAHWAVKAHLKELCVELHCSFIPLGRIRTGCKFERALLFKALADQIGLPCTLQRCIDGRILFNELPLPLEVEQDIHCDKKALSFVPWRMLRPTHIVDLMYNVGELYPLQSREALQYRSLC